MRRSIAQISFLRSRNPRNQSVSHLYRIAQISFLRSRNLPEANQNNEKSIAQISFLRSRNHMKRLIDSKLV